MSKIEWTGETWNPVVGCSKISEGCRNCYAINQAYRNAAMGAKLSNPGRLKYYEGLTEKRNDRVEWTGVVRFVLEALEIPQRTKKPTTWFVNSMSDLFHESVTDEQLDRIFAVMALTPCHTYQVLTKRPERMFEYFHKKEFTASTHLSGRGCWAGDMARFACENLPGFEWEWAEDDPEEGSSDHVYDALMDATSDGYLPNVWLGVTVENQKAADERIPLLLQTPAAIRFLSCEPLLEKVYLDTLHWQDMTNIDCLRGKHGIHFSGDCEKIDWVIVGGESGAGARPCDIAWVESIVEQCRDAGVACFVKQLGTHPILGGGSNNPVFYTLSKGKGGNPDEWPESLRVREMPEVTA